MSDRVNYAAIWDMDGTLVDTGELHFAAWETACRELDRPFSRADFAATFGQRNPEIFRWLFGQRFNDRQIDELAEHKEQLYRDAARKVGVEPLPGVMALLQGLQAAGFLQAVGSSAPRGNLDLILEMTGMGRYFQAVAAAEDTTRGKPDPQVFLCAASRLQVEPRHAIVFEDAVAGVEAARAGGMKCIAVRFVGHHSEEKLRSAGADAIVNTLEDVSAARVLDLLRQSS